MTWEIKEGDCVQVMAAMPAESVDAVVCDPPYGLEFMGKDWDRPWRMGKVSDAGKADGTPFRRSTGTPSWAASGNPVCRNCGGTKYDRTRPNGCKCDAPNFPNEAASQMRAFQVWCEEWAREAFRVLKPGGHLLAFGGTRTYHRMAAGVEDAGFEIRDQLQWLYGSGFPKSLDVSKAIDACAAVNDETARRITAVAAVIREYRERAGLERAQVSEAVVGTPSGACWNWEHQQLPSVEMWPKIKSTLAIPDDFDGLIEGDRARFIAAERAVIGLRQTGIGTGGGSTPIIGDGSRDVTAPATDDAQRWEGWGTALKPAHEPIVLARKPLTGTVAANVLAHGTGAINVDGCRIEGDAGSRNGGAAFVGSEQTYAQDETTRGMVRTPYDGAAGRWPANVLLDPVAAQLLDEQTGELISGANPERGADGSRMAYGEFAGQADANPQRGIDRGGASRFFYVAKASSAERSAGLSDNSRNVHPTVKPIDVMRWLVRLVTPPGGTVLDPFTGSGTTGCAAVLERVNFVGIERQGPEWVAEHPDDDDYIAIADARVRWWAQHPEGVELVKAIEAGKARRAISDAGQLGMFDGA